MAVGVGRGGDQGQQGQQGLLGQPGQQQVGGRDFHQPARDLEVNTTAKAQADKSTLKVCSHFPNCVSEADYPGVPAQWGLQRGQVWRRHRHQGDSSFLFRWTFCVQRFQPRINHELVKVSGLQQWARRDRESGKRWKMNGSLMGGCSSNIHPGKCCSSNIHPGKVG